MVSIEELITVVVPAYNSEATIDTTLKSVRNQTYRNIEIIVVVDGATDRTEEVSLAHAAQDDRVKVLVTPNGGLCAARNAGARAGSGAFIAPLDADDVWHPEKLQKQLEVFAAGGEKVGMVYTLYRRIDQLGYVMLDGARICWSGQIFNASLLYNCVRNGSSVLMRTEAFEQAGGYSMELNRLGCEDYLLQLLISHDWDVGVAPEYLTGYRYNSGSMSRNHVRMAQALRKMLDIVARQHPDAPDRVMDLAQCQATAELAVAYARTGKFYDAMTEFFKAARTKPILTASCIMYRLGDFGYRTARLTMARLRTSKPPHFDSFHPTASSGIAQKPLKSRSIQRLLDQNTSPNSAQ